jgi:hypothetical protein
VPNKNGAKDKERQPVNQRSSNSDIERDSPLWKNTAEGVLSEIDSITMPAPRPE